MPQTVSIIIALIGAAGTVYGIVTAAMQMRRAARKDDTAGGHTTGTICTELGYIKANTDEIKAEQREQRKTNTEVVSRLTAVEASAKQAHQRSNGLENRIK